MSTTEQVEPEVVEERVGLTVPRLVALMEDGTRYEVQADNRDLLRWDETAPRKGWGDPQKAPFMWMTFLSWSALKRTRQYLGTWEEYRAAAVDVTTVEVVDVDPTRTAVTLE